MMSRLKRKSYFNQSLKEETKKFRDVYNSSITCIENLSNELFYEIFDYLVGSDIYQAFSNLNKHFQQLLNSSFLLFKIIYENSDPEEIFFDNWKQMMIDNRHQLYSIHLLMSSSINSFVTSSLFIINSSLNHIESLAFWEIQPDILMSVLVKLPSLPRLFSLKITVFEDAINLTDMYRLVFNLPVLKYYKFYATEIDLSVSLPMATNAQLTSIENLHIDHFCNFHELSAIVSYTPQLRHLKFTDDSSRKLNTGIIPRITLINLTYLSIESYSLTFNEWEMFIRQVRPKLKVLYFTIRSEDIEFLNAYRWERFISHYLSELENFSLQYHENLDKNQIFETYPSEPNQFNSSFWIERQWIFEAEIEFDYIMYSIRPYKTRWYEYPCDKIVNTSMKLSKAHRLINSAVLIDIDSRELFIKAIKRILTITPIYHLETSLRYTCFITLIQMMGVLSELDSLKVYSILFDQSRILSVEEHDIVHSILNGSKITKVQLGEINFVEEIFLLMTFCPNMSYLKVNHIHLIDIELCLRHVLKKISCQCNEHLRSLCFCVPGVDDQTIKSLKKMISDEKLLINYTIKRVLDEIYVQWK